VGDNQINDDKNAGTLLAILMAMTMQRYGTMCITQWSISRATLEAPTTGKCLCPITLTATMVIEIWGKHKKNNKTQLLSNYCTNQSLFVSENFIPRNGPAIHLHFLSSPIICLHTT
jgi:hypothetical protein